MATQYKFVSFRQPMGQLVPEADGSVKALTIDFLSSIPEVAEQMDGWDVVNTQLIPAGESFLWVFTLALQGDAPDSPGDLKPGA